MPLFPTFPSFPLISGNNTGLSSMLIHRLQCLITPPSRNTASIEFFSRFRDGIFKWIPLFKPGQSLFQYFYITLQTLNSLVSIVHNIFPIIVIIISTSPNYYYSILEISWRESGFPRPTRKYRPAFVSQPRHYLLDE